MGIREFIFSKVRALNHLRCMYPYVLSAIHCDRPRQVDIELSNRCNLRCKMCWFHGENGLGNRYEDGELTTKEVFSIVDQLVPYKSHIYIGGSEPFMRKDFLMILQYLKSRNLFVTFTTNGTMLEAEQIGMLVKLGVDRINFSIDGNRELHDYVRGRGAFGKVTQSVRKISECKKIEAHMKPVITVNITLTRSLIGRLKETVNEIRQSTHDGADFYRLHHLWYVSQNELALHQATVRKKLGCSAPGAASHLLPSSQIFDPRALVDEITSLSGLPKVTMFPDLQYADMLKYYSENPMLGNRCIAPFLGAVIKPNGDVKFCPDEWIDDYTLGNLRNDSFHSIWNNKKARKFRSVILKEKHFEGCNRCSWMYSFGSRSSARKKNYT